MLSVPQKTLSKVKKLLLRQQKEVEKNLKEVETEDAVKDLRVAESSEPGTDSWMAEVHTRTMAVSGALSSTATNIKRALLKIRKGNY